MKNYERKIESSNDSDICIFPEYYLTDTGNAKQGKKVQGLMCKLSHPIFC